VAEGKANWESSTYTATPTVSTETQADYAQLKTSLKSRFDQRAG